ncbi:MAG TPA: hypothetical protein VGH36_05960, partial [Acetobacteraceae bacterium]
RRRDLVGIEGIVDPVHQLCTRETYTHGALKVARPGSCASGHGRTREHGQARAFAQSVTMIEVSPRVHNDVTSKDRDHPAILWCGGL